jgi:hypothetical protein
MKKNVMSTLLALFFAAVPAGMVYAAGQAAPSTTPLPVSDKDVFAQVEKLVEQSGKTTTAVTEMNTTLNNAVKRNRELSKIADPSGSRVAILKDDNADAYIKTVADQAKALRCGKFEEAPKQDKQLELCRKVEQASFDLLTMLKDNLEKSRKRAVKILALLDELNMTTPSNLMQAADLQSRIQVETALLQNEKTMVDMAIVKNEQEIRLYNQLLVALAKDGPGDAAGNRFYIR